MMKLTSTILATTLLFSTATGTAHCQSAETKTQAAREKNTKPSTVKASATDGEKTALRENKAPGEKSAPREKTAAAEKNAPGELASQAGASKSGKLPFVEELDKIDDVNPYVIKSVIIEGNKLISRSQIKGVIKTKPGDFYHRKDVEEDLNNIYQLGYFDGQQIHVSAETTSAGMVINIKVKENPLLKKVTFSGNHIVPTDKMQEHFKTLVQKPRSSTQINTAIKAIEEMYKSQGYLLARAACAREEQEGVLPITIDEGNLKEIKVTGLPEDQKKIVQDSLTLKAGEPYNEKQLSTDLNEAIKSGKVEKLQRQVDKSKAGGGYILTISALPASRAQQQTTKTAAEPALDGSKPKPALPVLNRLIKSPMYKNIK